MRMPPVRLSLLVLAVAVVPARVAAQSHAEPSGAVAVEDAVINDNRVPAGALRDGVLTVRLVAAEAIWRPDAGPGERMFAFAEEGEPAHIPGPLLRVPTGTTIVAHVRNALADTLRLHGMIARPATRGAPVRIAPGATAELRFEAGAPGNYFYWAATDDSTLATRFGPATQLSGALIVDARTGPAEDRVFVITSWNAKKDTTQPPPHVERDMVAINGRSWPHTERFRFTAGDTVLWRVVNVDTRPHPMHLHGFYFDVQTMGDMTRDTAYAAERAPRAVTHTLVPGSAMTMRFVAERPGRWLFHCHIAFHVSHYLSFAKVPDLAEPLLGDGMDHSVHGMAGLVVAMDVEPRPGDPLPGMPRDGRRVRLHVTGGPLVIDTATYGRLWYAEETAERPFDGSAPHSTQPLVLQRDEPVLITIVNHLPAPTAVHWHGIEVEDSYADGVPGFGGTPSSVTPLIAPGDSFVAAFTPPRSGTFIFHSHANESVQIDGGLAAPLLVVDDRTAYDAEAETILFIGGDASFHEGPWINGRPSGPIELATDRTTRLRIVNINPDALAAVTLLAGEDTLTWRPIAKDGADLSPALAVTQPASRLIGVGETLDVEVGPLPAGARFVIRPRRPIWRVEVPVVPRRD